MWYRDPGDPTLGTTDGAGVERPERWLARLGVASRREIARWIDAGRLTADGRVLKGGERIRCNARLALDGHTLQLPREAAARRVLLYNKPDGEIVSRHDPGGRPSVFAALPPLTGGRWIAVGRLDVATTGLLLFTTDGDLAARLMHPRHGLERRYLVRVHGRVSEAALARLLRGVRLDDGPARLTSCTPAAGISAGTNCSYLVSLAEGRNREVRRLFEAIGLQVSRLKRVGFGPVTLPRNLRRGSWRELGASGIAALDAACR